MRSLGPSGRSKKILLLAHDTWSDFDATDGNQIKCRLHRLSSSRYLLALMDQSIYLKVASYVAMWLLIHYITIGGARAPLKFTRYRPSSGNRFILPASTLQPSCCRDLWWKWKLGSYFVQGYCWIVWWLGGDGRRIAKTPHKEVWRCWLARLAIPKNRRHTFFFSVRQMFLIMLDNPRYILFLWGCD